MPLVKRSIETWLACSSADILRGGCSMAPAARSPASKTVTLPALTANIRIEPPTRINPSAPRNAASATGCASNTPTMVDTICPGSRRSRSNGSPPTTSATSTTPPTIGTASSVLNSVSATNCTRTIGQLAAVTSAPRFNANFSEPGTLMNSVWAELTFYNGRADGRPLFCRSNRAAPRGGRLAGRRRDLAGRRSAGAGPARRRPGGVARPSPRRGRRPVPRARRSARPCRPLDHA